MKMSPGHFFLTVPHFGNNYSTPVCLIEIKITPLDSAGNSESK